MSVVVAIIFVLALLGGSNYLTKQEDNFSASELFKKN